MVMINYIIIEESIIMAECLSSCLQACDIIRHTPVNQASHLPTDIMIMTSFDAMMISLWFWLTQI